MKFRTQQKFPFTLDELWAACSAADYVRRKYEAMGDLAARVQRFSGTARRIDVRVERELALGGLALPGWVRHMGALPNVVRQHSTWRRAGNAGAQVHMTVEVPSLPVLVTGNGSLAETVPGTTDLAIDWDARVGVPVLGGPGERVLAALVRQAMRRDRAFTVKYVREQRS